MVFRFPWGKRFALLVVLGYSRLLWLRFYQQQTMRVLFECLALTPSLISALGQHVGSHCASLLPKDGHRHVAAHRKRTDA